MTAMDPARNTPAALAAIRSALAAAQAAPAVESNGQSDEDEQADIATPRAKAAVALEAALKARRDWYRMEGARSGQDLCKTLIEMCSWHDHPDLRSQVLALQERGLLALEATPDGQPSPAAVDGIKAAYERIKPREDDGAAIAAALGMTLEEARAVGLVGTLDVVEIDEEVPALAAAETAYSAGESAAAASGPEEDLETLFRREALQLVTKSLPQALQRFWREQQSFDAMLSVRRGFHTLKGDARVTAQTTSAAVAAELEGLAVLAEAAEDIIDYLLGDDPDMERPAPPLPAGAFSLLNEAASALAQRLEARAPLEHEADLVHRLQLMQGKAAALSATLHGEPPPPVRPVPAPNPVPSTPPASRRVGHPMRPPAPRPVPATPATNPLLPTFLDEARRLMPDLHRALGALSENPADEDALVRARVKLHTLKGGAALVGEDAREIQDIAHSAEDLFELIEDFQLRGAMNVVPQEVLDGVQDAEDALQALLDILLMQGQSGRLVMTTRLLPAAPRDLVARLNDIAERVRAGAFSQSAAGSDSASADAMDAYDLLVERWTGSTGSLSPILAGPAPLLQRPDLTPFHEPAAADDATPAMDAPPAARSGAPADHLHTLVFQDMLAHVTSTKVYEASAAIALAKMVEDRAGALEAPFTLYACVQYLSSYEHDRSRYVALAGEHGHIYIFGKPDVVPEHAEHITIVPLATGDALCAEIVVILDTADAPAAFFAHVDPAERMFAPPYIGALVEDAAVVREAAARLRAVLEQDAALIATRRAQLATDVARMAETPAAPPLPAPVAEPPSLTAQEYGKERGTQVALEMLEDLSVRHDALGELVGRMARQSTESRRSTRRLRTLVERVGSELADLRSELVRTTRRSGEWDLLEKEEYTAVDVLLMQLEEALADLEEGDNSLRRDLGEAHAHIEAQDDSRLRAQRALLNASMIPLAHLEDRLAHAVRSQSRRLGKPVSFKMDGGDLLLDGRIAESLFDPLMHLINNAIDHGMEETSTERASHGKPAEGLITVRGRASGDGVVVEVNDDGRGIDPERVAAVAISHGIVTAQAAASMSAHERVALIWRPGFSTARTVSTISGRGMGMKSVLDDISGLQGRVEVRTEVGKGTTFSLILPRSLAMMRVEVVREGSDLVAVPITQLVTTHAVPYHLLAGVDGEVAVRLGDRTLQIYPAHLANGPAGDGEAGHGILLEIVGRPGGIVVDEVLGSQYIPVRAAPAYLRQRCGLLGYAVGGAGRILSIVDLPTLVERAAVSRPPLEAPASTRPAPLVLVVDDSQTMRRALRDTLSRAGFQVQEAPDGRAALALCARALPDLITLDMEMPGMDGLEALAALRLLPNGGAQVPVFMITSRQQARHRAAALAAGVTRYFTKPYDSDELIGAAQLALAESMQQQREAAS